MRKRNLDNYFSILQHILIPRNSQNIKYEFGESNDIFMDENALCHRSRTAAYFFYPEKNNPETEWLEFCQADNS